MRQRVLLVAGWVIAAVVTSLVASGAVAVAGGQVSDRPLRPLSAAEVAALPAGDTDSSTASLTSPLPPAAPQCRPELLSGGATPQGPDSCDELDPAGGEEGDAGIFDPQNPDGQQPAPDVGELIDAGPDVSIPTEVAIVHVEGGAVAVAAGEDGPFLSWATALPGYRVERTYGDDGVLRVSFTRNDIQSGVVVRMVDGALDITTFTGIR